MRHAYLVMAHTQFDTLSKLLAEIDDERNDIYLHVDAKARDFDPSTLRVTRSRLTLIPRRDVRWGSFRMVQVELNLLRAAAGYGYVHLLSGMDLPLRSQDEIHAFFDQADGTEFINYFEPEHWAWSRERLSYYYPLQSVWSRPQPWPVNRGVERAMHALTTVQRVVGVNRLRDASIDVRSGDQWFSVTGAFVDYLLSRETWIRRVFRSSQCPDEHLVQMIAANSPFADRVAGRSLRSIKWDEERGLHPQAWTVDDLPQLLSAEGDLFARKFDTRVDAEVIDRLLQQRGGLVGGVTQGEPSDVERGPGRTAAGR